MSFKFFSRKGEVRCEDERLVYRPDEAGPQEVAVFAVDPVRRAATQRGRQLEAVE